MAEKQPKALIALDIMEKSPSIAQRVGKVDGVWRPLFVTNNVQTYGYTAEELTSGKVNMMDILHPDDAAPLEEAVNTYIAQGVDHYTVQYRIFTKNGGLMWVSDSRTVTRDEKGDILYIDCMMQNHTEAVEKQARVQAGLARQQAMDEILQALQADDLDESFMEMLATAGGHLGISRAVVFEDNPSHTGCTSVFEWDNEGTASLADLGCATLDYKRDIPEVARCLGREGICLINSGELPKKSVAAFKKSGVIAKAAFAVYQGEKRYGFICFEECAAPRAWTEDDVVFMRNIAKVMSTALLRRKNEEAIKTMAYRDQLTGLVNRYGFEASLAEAIWEAKAARGEGYVLFIDMDDFKVINEGYGHDYGDALLVAVADYLQEQYSEQATLFRFGGDEFTVLVGHQNAHLAQEIVESLLARARHPWVVMEREFYCTISIGAVCFPDGGTNATEVTKNADIALYRAKNMGKNSCAMYNQSIDNDSLNRAETEHKMREAIENDFAGFVVHYQPIVDLRGRVTGAEALVRWSDAEGGIIYPGSFIPLAEYLGLIVPLGEFVLREAALLCKKINEAYPDFTMNVNISIRQFQQHDFLARVEEILTETGVNFGNLVLEVTEGMLVQDMEHMQMMAGQLQEMGLRLAMDDFGTGYSSLNNMRQLPLDSIKIDRSFIRDVAADAYSKSFVRLITDLAHSMGRTVCVEGVETAAQYRYVAECAADSIQGFHFFKPMPAERLKEMMGIQPEPPKAPPAKKLKPKAAGAAKAGATKAGATKAPKPPAAKPRRAAPKAPKQK